MRDVVATRNVCINDMYFTISATPTKLWEEKRNEFGQPYLKEYEVYAIVIYNHTTGETEPFKWCGNAFDGIEDAIVYLEGNEE